MYSLRYPACNAHVPYCHLWPAWLYNIFPHYLITAQFSKVIEHKMCFDFLYNLCLKHFSHQEELSEVFSKVYAGLPVKYQLFSSDFNDT